MAFDLFVPGRVAQLYSVVLSMYPYVKDLDVLVPSSDDTSGTSICLSSLLNLILLALSKVSSEGGSH